ncbi:MAG: CorA family divalent cation transporter [Anaerovoracaceae bacterium]
MKYTLDPKIKEVPQDYIQKDGEIIIEVQKNLDESTTKLKPVSSKTLARSIEQVNCCKADTFKDSIVGTFLVPNKEDLLKRGEDFSFHIAKDSVLFVDDGEMVNQVLAHLSSLEIMEKNNLAHFFFEFMEFLIRDDILFLQQYEEKLAELEEELLGGNVADFNERMLRCRRELLVLSSYYHQLMHLSEQFEENANGMFLQSDEKLFDLFSSRVDRLLDNVQLLREYTLQMRELYQSQIDIRQNKTMQFLTVVTTLFMPLTLIVGWYGMNFKYMPELGSPYGYLVIIFVSVVITLFEIAYFKKKKWWNDK